VAKILYEGAISLETFPNRGRPGRIAGTRELVFPPYIIVYRTVAQIVEVLRIYPGAQDWP
jgi:toxin ParE1/3/4